MEQRRTARWPARLRVMKLFDSSKRFLIECRVLDLSRTGARLQPEVARPLPMRLNVRSDEAEPFQPARLVWSRAGEIGITFIDPDKDISAWEA